MSLSADELPWGRPRPKFREAPLLAQDPAGAPSDALIDLDRTRRFWSGDSDSAIRQHRYREGRARTSGKRIFDYRTAIACGPDHQAACRRATINRRSMRASIASVEIGTLCSPRMTSKM